MSGASDVDDTAEPESLPPMFQALFELAPDAMIVVDGTGHIILANPQAEVLFDYPAQGMHGLVIERLLPEKLHQMHRAYRDAYMDNPRVRPMGAGYELVGVRRDGTHFPVEIGLSPITTREGRYFAASIRDISETQRARQALVRARHDACVAQIGRLALEAPSYESLADSIPGLALEAIDVDAVAILFTGTGRSELHLQAAAGLSLDAADRLPHILSSRDILGRLVEADRSAIVWHDLQAGELPAMQAGLAEAGYNDAALVPLFDRVEPMGILIALIRDQRGFDRDRIHFLQSIANLLAAAVQRSRSEEQLAHAQRLDAVGQLTGGIAHDFNNLLTVVSGNLQLLEVELGEYAQAQEIIESALRAVGRGAELTRKLLAFARRQRLTPRALAPAQMLTELGAMLKRTLGESIDIRIECANDVPDVYADPAELDTALVNLALNARDAMPRGGRLTISARGEVVAPGDEASELKPGRYVVLGVADSGIGMSPDVLARAFEPFFTTKDAGKGSGLGLSMVYGFVKQSGGHLGVDSQLGYGTRIELHLPSAGTGAATSAGGAAAVPSRGRETVLVVEDEPEVRGIAVAFLRSLGYTVHVAENARKALRVLATHADIALLFSDVVLGSGMNGNDLAHEARRLYPHLTVLLTSGYERPPRDSNGPVHEAFELLRKPYRREELAAAVRQVLDRS